MATKIKTKIKKKKGIKKKKIGLKKGQSSSLPKLVITVALMLALGTIFGLVGYLLQNSNKVTRYVAFYEIKDEASQQPLKEEKISEQESGETGDIARQTYKNTDYGFEFSYPQNWKLTRDLFSDNFMMILLKTPDNSENIPRMTISVLDNSDYDDLHKKKNETIIICGIDAVIYEYADGYEINFSRTLANREDISNKEYVQFYYQELAVTGKKLTREQWKHFDSVNEIISSFIFIERTGELQ